MELWFSHSVCICFVYNHSNDIDMVKFFNDAIYYIIIALILMGFYSGLIYDSMLVLIIGSMIGFVMFNLGVFGKKKGCFFR